MSSELQPPRMTLAGCSSEKNPLLATLAGRGDREAGINTHVAERQDAVRPRCVLRFWMPPAQGVFCAFGRLRRQGN